jgi:hypothetical protein
MAACPVLHVVADGEDLPLRVDSLGTRATAVVQVVPGIPAPTIPAHLDQPWPDLIRRCVDCDGHRRPPVALGDHLGTGIWPGDFLIGCTPVHEPRAYPRSIYDCCCGSHGCDSASELHTASVRGPSAVLQGTKVTTRPTKLPRPGPEAVPIVQPVWMQWSPAISCTKVILRLNFLISFIESACTYLLRLVIALTEMAPFCICRRELSIGGKCKYAGQPRNMGELKLPA